MPYLASFRNTVANLVSGATAGWMKGHVVERGCGQDRGQANSALLAA
jgi:hypothetical protein